MENRVGNSHGTQIPKKSRSLDLKSLYKSKASNQKPKGTQNKPMKRKNSSVYGADVESKRKKSKKEVFHSSLKNADRNSKKSLAELYNGAPGSSANDAEDVKTGVSGRVNAGGSENGISFSLDGNAIQIPKRKRGFVGRKKIEVSQEIKVPGESGGTSASSDQTKNSEEGIRSDCENANQVDCSRDVKENANTLSNLDQDPKVETGTPASNDDLLLKKPHRNRRKKKNVEVSHTKFVQVAEPSLNSSVKTCNDLQEDDEENLEENAAMMLSLRFDPSCTGFCSKSKVSAQSSKCKSMGNPRRNSLSCRSRSLAGSDSASLDAADRILRPRKQNKQKGLLRKRRHFYEIFAEELDALWVLNKRIKVFWPLDERWYYGLVIDYDEERKLLHVKYDDRDDEWINLQNERFKLLLLRGEVAGKAGQKRVVLTEKQLHERKGNMKLRKDDRKRNSSMADDSSVMDSEPIISWLARSKPSTSHAGKKTKNFSLAAALYEHSIR